MPIRVRPPSGSAIRARRSATTRVRIPPTPRQEMRKRRQIALFEVWVASQAA